MRFILLFVTGLVCSIGLQAQNSTSILDKRIDVSFKNEKITTVLNRIGQLGNFSFSYNSAIISNDEVITIEKKNATIREILNEVFRGSMTYKEKGNHIILTRVTVKAPKSNVTSMIISGYVEDWFTNERIIDASVYEKSSITSVVTDEFGFFRLKLDKHAEKDIILTVSKRDYIDEVITITDVGNQYFLVSLKRVRPLTTAQVDSAKVIEQPEVSAQVDSSVVEPAPVVAEDILLPYNSTPNVENIRDTLYRDIQVSILPFVGTNGRMSGNIVNDYSINMFGGYSMGTRRIELGFFFNVDRGDVSFLQVAGFGNVNGGDVTGVQASGFFNLNGKEVSAIQATGYANINFKDFEGVQMSGLTNINLAAANGVKVAGMLNLSNGTSRGVSLAGFANVHRGDFRGPQIAGFTNINSKGTVKGTQVSGFFNYSHKVHGSQIGILNYADSLTGVPIGVLSIVKHGYHKLELSADEVFYSNIAFRSGVRQFYNIIMAGYNPKTPFGDESVWTFGYGLGTAPRIFRWLHLNLDLQTQHVNKGGFTAELSSLNKAQVGFDFRLARGFSLYMGGSVNAYLTRETYTDYPALFSDIKPNVFYDHTYSNDMNLKMWFGGKVALRFF